jgi:lipid A 4'-phosphatase
MNRTGVKIALALAIAVGVPFAIFPQLDLTLVAPFFDPARQGFWVRLDPTLRNFREWSNWVIALIAAPAFFAIPIKLLLPKRPLLVPGRAVVLMIATLALAPGVLANLVLKDYWGRSRPIDVSQFGGDEHYVAWWDPRGDCPKNCSFIAGEPSGAFWTLAPALLLPPPWRAVGTAAALIFGAGVSLLRVASGGHFVTDAAFAGVFTFLVIWLTHGLLYRWAATRISDEGVDAALARLGMPGYTAMLWVIGRVRALLGLTR